MPQGIYLHTPDHAAAPERDPVPAPLEERFRCAPGAGGWRYVSERSDGLRVDLTVDGRWRQLRVEIGSGDPLVRGGVVGREALWIRGGREHAAEAAGFLGDSPAFLVAVARFLRLEPGRRADVRLVRLHGPALSGLTVAQRWRLAEITAHETDLRPLRVERYDTTDLDSGETSTFHLAGDVVLDAPGIELADLWTPPSRELP